RLSGGRGVGDERAPGAPGTAAGTWGFPARPGRAAGKVLSVRGADLWSVPRGQRCAAGVQ
ncbi:MAG TPA: hypothetical protein VI365_17480, partial [Trebonia sp.]